MVGATAVAEYLESISIGETPVCIAKTQCSLTDELTRRGLSTSFCMAINEVTGSGGLAYRFCTGELNPDAPTGIVPCVPCPFRSLFL